LTVSRHDACCALDIGLTKLKTMIKSREIEEVRFGRASRITVRSLRARVGERPTP
jgi:hypothetical protein